MKFKFVKEVSEPVNGYNGAMVKTGDVIELSGELAAKAEKNPDWRREADVTQSDGSEVLTKPARTTKKKRGRPRKYGNESRSP